MENCLLKSTSGYPNINESFLASILFMVVLTVNIIIMSLFLFLLHLLSNLVAAILADFNWFILVI